MEQIIQLLQVSAGLLWLGPVSLLAAPFLRTVRGRGDRVDVLRLPMFFVALIQVGFSVRWLVWPHTLPVMGLPELTFWGMIYLASMGVAVLVIRTYFLTRNL